MPDTKKITQLALFGSCLDSQLVRLAARPWGCNLKTSKTGLKPHKNHPHFQRSGLVTVFVIKRKPLQDLPWKFRDVVCSFHIKKIKAFGKVLHFSWEKLLFSICKQTGSNFLLCSLATKAEFSNIDASDRCCATMKKLIYLCSLCIWQWAIHCWPLNSVDDDSYIHNHSNGCQNLQY